MSESIKILNDRLAKGEISEDEYEKLKNKISDNSESKDSTDEKFELAGKIWESGIIVSASLVAAYFLWEYRPLSIRGQNYVIQSLDEVYLKPPLFFIGLAIAIAVFLYGIRKAFASK